MTKTFIQICVLTFNIVLVLGQIVSIDDYSDYIDFNFTKDGDDVVYKNYPPLVKISGLINTGDYTEAVKQLIDFPETLTTEPVVFNEIIRQLREKMDEETFFEKIFELIRNILYQFKFNSKLYRLLHLIFQTMFRLLVAENKLKSFEMIQLNEHAKYTARFYSGGYPNLEMFKRMSNNTLPSAIQKLVWNTDLKCIKNKKYDSYLFQTEKKLVTTSDSNNQQWRFQYLWNVGNYLIYNSKCNCSLEKINEKSDGDIVVGTQPIGQGHLTDIISWRIELINDSDFYLIDRSTRGHLFADSDYRLHSGIKRREVLISTKAKEADVWTFVNCYSYVDF